MDFLTSGKKPKTKMFILRNNKAVPTQQPATKHWFVSFFFF